jgi:Tol biopolymer transport system component
MNGLAGNVMGVPAGWGWSGRLSCLGALLALAACSDPMPTFAPPPDEVPQDRGAGGTLGEPVPMQPPDNGGGSSNTGAEGEPLEDPDDDSPGGDPRPEDPPPALVCGNRIVAGGACFCATGDFGAPELITGLEVPGSTFGPSLTSDGFTLFFSLIDGVGDDGSPLGPNENDEDIFVATRATRTSAFNRAQLVDGLDDGGSEEGTPFISVDGRSLYFFSNRGGEGSLGDRDIWVATRAGSSGAFDAPRVVPGINSPELDHLPWLSADGLELLFVSDRPSPNAFSNIWVTRRTSTVDPFAEPVELEGINTGFREEGFSLSADGLTLVFSSNREGSADLDIWLATRSERDATFGEPVNLSAVNSAAPDGDAMLSPDGLELFFTSERNGTNQLFRATRQCEF